MSKQTEPRRQHLPGSDGNGEQVAATNGCLPFPWVRSILIYGALIVTTIDIKKKIEFCTFNYEPFGS